MDFPTIKHISEWFIKPKYDMEESKQPYYLSPWDLVLLSIPYMQTGLLFTKPTQEDFTISNFLESLRDSLSLTLVHFYPLAGQLTTKLDQDNHRCLIFVDCNKGPGARFVHSTLDLTIADILHPTHVPPVVKSLFDLSNGEVNYDGHFKPLLSVQVTELKDGIFIGCSTNHGLIDGTSVWHFWNVWSEIHRGEGKAVHVPSYSIPVHKRWVPEGYALDKAFLPYIHPDEFITRLEQPQDLRERFFHFSAETVANLKAKANQETKNQAQISSFQALLALIWRCIVRAKGLPPDRQTQCEFAANNRTRLDPCLPKEYFGNSIEPLRATTNVGELLDEHWFGRTALLLHQAVANYSNEKVREFFQSWFEAPFVYQLSRVVASKENDSVRVGSSPRFDVYGNEFATVGKPLAVRSGSATNYGGKVTMYPGREGGGSMDAAICLPLDTMRALESDREFMSATSFL